MPPSWRFLPGVRLELLVSSCCLFVGDRLVCERFLLGGLVFWKRVFLLIEVALYSIQLILELTQLTSLRLQLFDIFLESLFGLFELTELFL